MERITSRQNPLIAQIRKLNTSRSYRRSCGLFVGEGPKLLDEALRHGAEITAVVRAEGMDLPALPGIRQAEVPGDLLKSCSDTEHPQGVLFLCRIPELTPPERLPAGRYLVLDGVQDPGNVGTVWRTADAFGAEGLLLLSGCADPFSPKTVRATMGACFRLPVWELSAQDLWETLGGLPLYAAALRADSADVRTQPLAEGAVVIGSEGRGVSAEVLSLCQKTLHIPMRARCESLNAAIAAAVVLWEGMRTEGGGNL
ncbi:MAG: RNA methyltransferase [Oscillospiraceae bacterium]|nr:RNA methyltransferase [Oscillospiraceae bacterium]